MTQSCELHMQLLFIPGSKTQISKFSAQLSSATQGVAAFMINLNYYHFCCCCCCSSSCFAVCYNNDTKIVSTLNMATYYCLHSSVDALEPSGQGFFDVECQTIALPHLH